MTNHNIMSYLSTHGAGFFGACCVSATAGFATTRCSITRFAVIGAAAIGMAFFGVCAPLLCGLPDLDPGVLGGSNTAMFGLQVYLASTRKYPVDMGKECPNRLHKSIVSSQDAKIFWDSATGQEILELLKRLCQAVQGKTMSFARMLPASPVVSNIASLLDTMKQHVLGYATGMSHDAQHRFGNPAFRDWYAEISPLVESTMTRCIGDIGPLPAKMTHDAISAESLGYFLASLGEPIRLDYGTGHELHFLVFLYCLYRYGYLVPSDDVVVVLVVFYKYLVLMRSIEATFWLEPAGSHGVWGLDDYHFLPFLFGASQLIGHPHIRPKSIHSEEILEGFHSEYLYLDCIRHTNSVKTASLRWYSPLLDDISAVKTWVKVQGGLLKMYIAEVLHKRPIMQHFLVGAIVHFQPTTNSAQDQEHEHFPTCCGIRIPSVHASDSQKEMTGRYFLPFD